MAKKTAQTLVIQDNALTTARYEMTALEKNIMYAVMAQIEDADDTGKCYKISTDHISRHTERRVRYEDFEAALDRLIGRVIHIRKPEGGLLQVGFLSSADWATDRRSIELGIDPKMRPYLFALKKNFTLFGFEVAMSLNSRYSKRLYEMLCQFRSTELLRVSVQELKERFQLIGKDGVEQYSRWSSFESNVLKTAQTEINAKANFQFDYELKKQGRKVVSIEFIYRNKGGVPAKALEKPPTTSDKPPTVVQKIIADPKMARMKERLTNYGLTEQQADVIMQQHSHDMINRILYQIDCDRNEYRSPSGFLIKTFPVNTTNSR